jgi:copper chaperone CopZ
MEKTVNVGGMTCDGCERSVVNALRRLAGVDQILADHKTGTVTMTLESDIEHGLIVGAIEDAGYDVLPEDKRPLPMA